MTRIIAHTPAELVDVAHVGRTYRTDSTHPFPVHCADGVLRAMIETSNFRESVPRILRNRMREPAPQEGDEAWVRHGEVTESRYRYERTEWVLLDPHDPKTGESQ
jgi:hypothetical protein